MASPRKDGDGKYDKIRKQEATFRTRCICLGCVVIAAAAYFSGVFTSNFSGVFTSKEAGNYLHNTGGRDGGANHAAGEMVERQAASRIPPRGEEKQLRAKDTGTAAAAAAKVQATAAAAAKDDVADVPAPHLDEDELAREVEKIDAEVRDIKDKLPRGKFMETDPVALEATKRLQDSTRQLLHARYGPNEPYRVKIKLEFQPTMPDFKENGPDGEIVLEMAPSRLVPHSIFSFLEIARNWKGGGFHRIAGHVLQVVVRTHAVKHLAFQEYSPEWPHKKGTVGYAGRPSGPAWYVSIENNVKNHGPGSQQNHNPHEADSCFGKVIEGFDTDVQRVRKVPGTGFVNDRKKHVLMKKMTILVPGKDGEYVEWAPSSTQ